MSKKELMAKIKKNKKKEKVRHSLDWIYGQLRELADYVEMGTNNLLREKCLHAIRWLVGYAAKIEIRPGDAHGMSTSAERGERFMVITAIKKIREEYPLFYRTNRREVEDTLWMWKELGYTNALAVVALHPKFFSIVAASIIMHGNVIGMKQSHDGIFTIEYKDSHVDCLTFDGKVVERRIAA